MVIEFENKKSPIEEMKKISEIKELLPQEVKEAVEVGFKDIKETMTFHLAKEETAAGGSSAAKSEAKAEKKPEKKVEQKSETVAGPVKPLSPEEQEQKEEDEKYAEELGGKNRRKTKKEQITKNDPEFKKVADYDDFKYFQKKVTDKTSGEIYTLKNIQGKNTINVKVINTGEETIPTKATIDLTVSVKQVYDYISTKDQQHPLKNFFPPLNVADIEKKGTMKPLDPTIQKELNQLNEDIKQHNNKCLKFQTEYNELEARYKKLINSNDDQAVEEFNESARKFNKRAEWVIVASQATGEDSLSWRIQILQGKINGESNYDIAKDQIAALNTDTTNALTEILGSIDFKNFRKDGTEITEDKLKTYVKDAFEKYEKYKNPEQSKAYAPILLDQIVDQIFKQKDKIQWKESNNQKVQFSKDKNGNDIVLDQHGNQITSELMLTRALWLSDPLEQTDTYTAYYQKGGIEYQAHKDEDYRQQLTKDKLPEDIDSWKVIGQEESWYHEDILLKKYKLSPRKSWKVYEVSGGDGISTIQFVSDGKGHTLAYHNVDKKSIQDKTNSENEKIKKYKKNTERWEQASQRECLVPDIYPNSYPKEDQGKKQKIENHADFPQELGEVQPQHVLAQLLAWIDFEPHKLTKINQDAVKNIFDGETNSSGEKILGLKDYGFERKDVEDAVEKACKKKGGTTWKDYEAGEAIELTRKEIADRFLWDNTLMKKIGKGTKGGLKDGGALNVALFQAFALRMGGSGEKVTEPREKQKEERKTKIQDIIKDLEVQWKEVQLKKKTYLFWYDTGNYTKVQIDPKTKKPKGEPQRLNKKDLEEWINSPEDWSKDKKKGGKADKQNNIAKFFGVEGIKQGKKTEKIEDKSQAIDGKFGPGTFLNLPWGKRESALIIPQKKTIKTTTFTITTNLEDKTNNEKPTINKPITLAEVQEIPVKKGTTDLISKASYSLNQRLNTLMSLNEEPFPGYTPAEFIKDLVDLNGRLRGLLGDTNIPRLADRGLNFWHETRKGGFDREILNYIVEILDDYTGKITDKDRAELAKVEELIDKLDLKKDISQIGKVMDVFWTLQMEFPLSKIEDEKDKQKINTYLEQRWKRSLELLWEPLNNKLSEKLMREVGNIYERALLSPTKDRLAPYTERVLLELNTLKNNESTVEDLMKRSYTTRYDKELTSKEAKAVIKGSLSEKLQNLNAFYTRALPKWNGKRENWSPEVKMFERLQSWYNPIAREENQHIKDADKFWRTCERLDKLGTVVEIKTDKKSESKGESKEKELATMGKLLFLIQDVNFDGSVDILDVNGVHTAGQMYRMFMSARRILAKKTKSNDINKATDLVVQNIVKYMKSKGYAQEIHNLPENPITEQFYTWMKDKFFNTKMVQEALTNSIEDPLYIFTSGDKAMDQQLAKNWRNTINTLTKEERKQLNKRTDEQLQRFINTKGNLTDAEGNEIKVPVINNETKNKELVPIKITNENKEKLIKIITTQGTTMVNQLIKQGDLLGLQQMNSRYGGQLDTNESMIDSSFGVNLGRMELLEGLDLNFDLAASTGGMVNVWSSLSWRKGREPSERRTISADASAGAQFILNQKERYIPTYTVSAGIGAEYTIDTPESTLDQWQLISKVGADARAYASIGKKVGIGVGVTLSYKEDRLWAIDKQHKEIIAKMHPMMTTILAKLNPDGTPEAEGAKIKEVLQKGFGKTSEGVLEHTVKFLYGHIKSLRIQGDAEKIKAVATLISNRFATQWKNFATQRAIDEGWEFKEVSLGATLSPVLTTIISVGVSIEKIHTPNYEDDALSESIQDFKLNSGKMAMDTGEQMDEKWVNWINEELFDIKGISPNYRGKKLEVKNGELVIPVRLMQNGLLEVSMHPEFFWRGKTSWTGELVKNEGTYYNVTDQGEKEELKDWKEPTISLPLNLPYEFFIENETNRNAYRLRIAKPGYEAKKLSTNIGDMIASDTQKNKSTRKDNKEGGNSRERLTTKEVIQETETKLTFSSKLLEDLHLLNEEKNQDFLTYLGTIDKTYPSKYQDFLAKKDYQTLQAFLSADTKFTEKKEAILKEFQTNEENKSQITDRLIQLFARIDATRISDGLGLKRVLKNHKEEEWGKMFPYAKKLRDSLFEKIKDKDPISRTIDPSIIGFTAYYTPQAGAFKGMKLTALGATTMLEQEEKAVDREGILIERDLKDDPGSIDPQVIQDVMTWLFKENISGNQPGEGALFDAQYGKQRDIIKQQISKYLDGKLPLTAAQISDDLLRKMLLGEEVVIGGDKVQLDVHPVVYLMGECANESIGFRIHKATVKKTVTENITETPATANHYTIRTNIYNAKSIINTQTETKTFEFSGTVDTREAAKKAKERLQSSKSNMNAGDQDTGGGDQDTGGGDQDTGGGEQEI